MQERNKMHCTPYFVRFARFQPFLPVYAMAMMVFYARVVQRSRRGPNSPQMAINDHLRFGICNYTAMANSSISFVQKGGCCYGVYTTERYFEQLLTV